MFLDSLLLLVIVTASGFIMGIIDAAIGMGYGTVLTPILFIIGFDPIQIIPAVLISQLIGGLWVSFFNHRLKNVDFTIGGNHLRAAMLLGVLSAMGAIASILLLVNLSKFYLALYIGIMTTILGLIVLATHKKRFKFSWPRMMGIGLLAAFNKGLTGGGYGPLVTVGQIMSGVGEKSAVSITALSEVIVSLTAVFTYILTRTSVDWVLTLCLIISVSFSAPIAAFVVKRMGNGKLKLLIGITTFLLGFATILKTIHS